MGKECVMANQLRWTSKSVEWLFTKTVDIRYHYIHLILEDEDSAFEILTRLGTAAL